MTKFKKYKVIISDRALEDIDKHTIFASNVSTVAAEKIKSKILGAIKSLCFMPHSFARIDIADMSITHFHRLKVKPRYLIIYHIDDNTVFIEAVLDARQNNNKRLSSLS